MPKLITKRSTTPPKSPPRKPTSKPSVAALEERLEETGLSLTVKKPNGDMPRFKDDLSDIEDTKLSTLMGTYRSWCEYAQGLAAKAKAQYIISQELFNTAYNEAYITLDGKTTEKKLHASVDENVTVLRQKLIQDEMYMNALDSKVESFKDAIATLSREISAREKKNWR